MSIVFNCLTMHEDGASNYSLELEFDRELLSFQMEEKIHQDLRFVAILEIKIMTDRFSILILLWILIVGINPYLIVIMHFNRIFLS